MLGFDIKNFDAPGILGNNATSARIDLASTSERYFPGVVTTAIDVFAPDFSPSTKTVTNLTGGDPARVGDTLRYTVTFVNAGQDPAINTSIEDPIPAGTSYVPGSLDVPAGVTGSFDAAANTVRVSPGNFPIGRSVTFTFDVVRRRRGGEHDRHQPGDDRLRRRHRRRAAGPHVLDGRGGDRRRPVGRPRRHQGEHARPGRRRERP